MAARRAPRSAATARPSRMAARSRGPARPSPVRESARARSGARARASRRPPRRRASSTRYATAACRRAMASRWVSGPARRSASSRAPFAVTVRSIVARRLRRAPRQGAGEFEVGPRRRVDRQSRAAILAGRDGQGRTGRELRPGDVEERRPGRRDLGPGELAEPLQGRDAVLLAQAPFGGGGLELGLCQGHDGGAALLPEPREGRIGVDRLRQDDLPRVVPGDGAGQVAARDLAQGEAAGGDVHRGEAVGDCPLPGLPAADRQEEVGAGRVEEPVLRDRAGGDEPHDLAADHGFGPALLGLGRILGLLAHRHPVAEGDETVEVVVGPFDRHAAHRDLAARVLAALRQDDAERPGRGIRILEEQLVEVAHPVEQEAVRIGGLDLDVLRHHRRRAGRVQAGRGRRVGGGADGGSGHAAS